MTCATQALELHIMMAWHISHGPSNCMNDGMACALHAPELHVMKALLMPAQSTGLHMMRIWYMSWRPQGFGPIGHKRLRVQYDMICAMSPETACNDGIAYASQATELQIGRVQYMLTQAPELHAMMA